MSEQQDDIELTDPKSVHLTEEERRTLRLAARDGVLAPGDAVLIEVERILVSRFGQSSESPPCAACGTDDETCTSLCASGGLGCCSACRSTAGCTHSMSARGERGR